MLCLPLTLRCSIETNGHVIQKKHLSELDDPARLPYFKFIVSRLTGLTPPYTIAHFPMGNCPRVLVTELFCVCVLGIFRSTRRRARTTTATPTATPTTARTTFRALEMAD
jgi:hypothetical protein